MQIAGIVAEYNPFHNGHFYQIVQTKKLTGCDAVIAIMSGNFSQRGIPTISDKYTRAKMALSGGVDLVLELPVPFATASAEHFAKASVSLLHQTQIVDFISFGSECGDILLLTQIAQTLIHDKPVIDDLIKIHLKEGLSFPRARSAAIMEHLLPQVPASHKDRLQEALESPNNILGIEYIKALINLNSTVKPFTVKRTGSNYHDTDICGPIASATAIRESFSLNSDSYKQCMPQTSFDLLASHQLPSMEKLASFLHFKLMFSQEENLYSLWDIPEDLLRTLVKLGSSAPSYADLVSNATSKTYTKATIQRALLRIILDFHKSDINSILSPNKLPYLRVLGCKKDSTWLMRYISEKSSTPLITNLGRQQHSLDTAGKQLLDYEIRATKLYQYLKGTPEQGLQDFSHPFILL